MLISYAEYLERTKEVDSRFAWISWKIEVCGMSPKEATIAAYDKDWGWTPLERQ